jgi:hypothetical protein
MVLALGLLLSGCAMGGPSTGGEQADLVNAAWSELGPKTSSENIQNWDVEALRRVKGREVADQFQGEIAPGCWKGPTPQPNAAIRPGTDYWFLHMQPKPATAQPWPYEGTPPATAPPGIPEPFLRDAMFLFDLKGHIVARKYMCVIY